MEGTVLFNGEKLTKKIKKRVGYVLQVCFLSAICSSLFPFLNCDVNSLSLCLLESGTNLSTA